MAALIIASPRNAVTTDFLQGIPSSSPENPVPREPGRFLWKTVAAEAIKAGPMLLSASRSNLAAIRQAIDLIRAYTWRKKI